MAGDKTIWDQPGAPDMSSNKKLTGGPSNYYLVKVDQPSREEHPPYTAECEDIMEALNLGWVEANIFKALWREAQRQNGNSKPGVDPLYDVEKVLYFAHRLARVAGLTKADVMRVMGFKENG